jgi:hypothetical protein
VKFSSADASASAIAGSIERETRAALAGHPLLVMPRLSVVGRLAAAAAVSEISISNLDAGVLAASGAHPACLWIAVRLAGTTGTAAAPQNFLAADYAYLCGEAVIKAICAYRWRLGDYPTGYLGQPVSDSYKENGTIRAILITQRLVQTDVLDAQGNVVGDIKPMAPQPARQEDFVEIGGHAYSAIDSITHDDATHSPVPAAIRAKYTDSAPFEYRLPVFLSNVGTPATNPVASIDAYFTQMRAGVTGHFSRPFAGAPTVALQSRAVNGVDNQLLTQANVTTF